MTINAIDAVRALARAIEEECRGGGAREALDRFVVSDFSFVCEECAGDDASELLVEAIAVERATCSTAIRRDLSLLSVEHLKGGRL
jgi:hypothetical protein